MLGQSVWVSKLPVQELGHFVKVSRLFGCPDCLSRYLNYLFECIHILSKCIDCVSGCQDCMSWCLITRSGFIDWWSRYLNIKPRCKADFTLECEQNTNVELKTMRTFDVDALPRWGKQHSAVQRTFGERLCDERSANSQMLSIDCRYIKGNLRTIRLCRVGSLPRRIPNNLQIYLHKHTHRFRIPRSRSNVNPP